MSGIFTEAGTFNKRNVQQSLKLNIQKNWGHQEHQNSRVGTTYREKKVCIGARRNRCYSALWWHQNRSGGLYGEFGYWADPKANAWVVQLHLAIELVSCFLLPISWARKCRYIHSDTPTECCLQAPCDLGINPMVFREWDLGSESFRVNSSNTTLDEP